MKSRAKKLLGGTAIGLALLTGVAWYSGNLARITYFLEKNSPRNFYEKLRDEGLVGTFDALVDKLSGDEALPTLRYSLADPAGAPPIESAEARARLPEFKQLPAADVASLRPASGQSPDHASWQRSHGNEFSDKFSTLDQITPANVERLAPAWVHKSGVDLGDVSKIGLTVQTNPIYAGSRVFVTDLEGRLLALDPATGKELWRLELPSPVARRGLLWSAGTEPAQARLYVPAGDGVYAVAAASGQIVRSFGANGKVGDQLSLITPSIVGDRLIIATLKPAVEAYDLATGALLWRRLLLDKPERKKGAYLYGGAPWAGMSADSARGRVYVATGNPRPQLIGMSRLGDNKNSCSVVAIDTRTGEIVWAFQEVVHDLWDVDIPAPPVLTTIVKDGRKIDVVVAVTKIGNTLVLDRDSGRPIFDYRQGRAPTSTIPGERTAAYQPALEIPPPFTKQRFEAGDVTDLSPAARAYVEHKLRDAKSGYFQPPILGHTVAAFGLQGGAEWPGAAVDPRTATMYLPSNQIPWLIRLNLQDTQATAESAATVPGNTLYQARCASCHGSARQGKWDGEREGDTYHPSLVGVSFLRERSALESVAAFALAHRYAGVESNAAELQQLFGYFAALDRDSDTKRSFMIDPYWQLLLDDKGNPGSKPPWGHLTAIDLNAGTIKWQIPFGAYDKLYRNGELVKGQRNTGGVIATATGLLFATGTVDDKIRAYAAGDGKELWSYKLPAAGSTPPTTYLHEGQQYLLVVATGGSHVGFSGRSDQIIAFKLK